MHSRPLLSFFVLAHVLSWSAWAPLAAAALGFTAARFSPYLHLVGGLGPLTAALVVTAACDGRPGLRRLFGRCLPSRGGAVWIGLAITAPIVLFAACALALATAGAGQVAWADVGRSVEYPGLGRGVYWIANIFFYGFGEEVGWRGFALPRFQARHGALASALLVSVAWASWHLPLFAFAGGFSAMGVGGALGWLSSMVTGSILMAALFNASRGSLLAVALFHGVLDIVMTSPVHGMLPSLMGAVVTVCGLAIPFVLGRADLSRTARVREPASDRVRAGGAVAEASF